MKYIVVAYIRVDPEEQEKYDTYEDAKESINDFNDGTIFAIEEIDD